MIRQIQTLAHHTFTTSIRQPIYTIVLLLTAGLLVLNVPLSAYTFDDDNKLMIDLSMSTMLLAGVVLAGFSASGAFTREIERGTVQMVLSKPVLRPALIVGKFAGVAAALLLAVWVWGLIFLMAVRHGVIQTASHRFDAPVLVLGGSAAALALGIAALANYTMRRHFGAVLARGLATTLAAAYAFVLLLGKGWQLQSPAAALDLQVLAALLLLAEAVLLVAAIAVAAATRLGQAATLSLCAVMLFLGLCSDYAFGRAADTSRTAAILYHLTPNLQFLWLSDALTQQHAVTAHYLLLSTTYGLLCIVAAIAVAVALFQRRQVV